MKSLTSLLIGVISSILFTSSLYSHTVYLKQADFDEGTYIISQPGTYVLAEDITFNPNSTKKLKKDAYHSGFLLPSQYTSKGGKYDDKAYGIGFFAAVAIDAKDVILDLNHHTIEQSPEFALQQRFFSVIELANQPFIPGQGPHNFGQQVHSAKNVLIKNGTIGRSSHHGIHGNGNESIEIQNVFFKDFEVAAVALNGVNGLTIENCVATSRRDVPVIGTFSAARFLKPYLDYLVENNSKTVLFVNGKRQVAAKDARDRIQEAINAVHEDLVEKGRQTIDLVRHPEEYALFHNPHQVIDGNCYGFLINAFGQAIEGFPVHAKHKKVELARNIRFKNVHVKGLTGKVNEIISFRVGDKGALDPVGAVFQLKNLHPDTGNPLTVSSSKDSEAIYTGNLLADAQALIAKAHLNGEFNGSSLDVTRLNIPSKVIEWIEADPNTERAKLAFIAPTQNSFLCNADSMFHVNKGVVGFKIDAAENVLMDNTRAEDITNLSEVGSDLCGYYQKSHPKATLIGCGGPKTRGYSIAGSSNVRIYHGEAVDVAARCGSAVGFDILTDSSHIVIADSEVDRIVAGNEFRYNQAPNEPPKAVGFRISDTARDIALEDVCARQLKGFAQSDVVLDESHSARVQIRCQK